jgi:lipopolysaccharide transport system permease protein
MGEEGVSPVAETIDKVTLEPAPASEPAAPSETNDLPTTVIEPRSGWQILNLRELWRFRELLFYLIWRDVKVRYKQTVLGAAWSVLQPLATMGVFCLFIGYYSDQAKFVTKYDYSLFVFAGVLPWTFFSNAINASGISVVGNQNLVTKIYFPRLLMPIGAVGANLVDFAIASVILAVLMACFGVAPTWTILCVPLILLLLIFAAVGFGTLLAALIVAHRDFRFILAFAMQMWMFATPTIYLAKSRFGPLADYLLPLNPAYGLIHNFRLAVLDGTLDGYSLGVSAAVSVVLVLVGCLYFRRVERGFADVI